MTGNPSTDAAPSRVNCRSSTRRRRFQVDGLANDAEKLEKRHHPGNDSFRHKNRSPSPVSLESGGSRSDGAEEESYISEVEYTDVEWASPDDEEIEEDDDDLNAEDTDDFATDMYDDTELEDSGEFERENSTLPDRLWQAMFPFQREGVRWAIAKRGGSVLIGDEMGLGKTVSALAISSYYKHWWPLLIITPASVLLNWRKELLYWIGDTLDGEREQALCILNNGKSTFNPAARVVIISYDLVSRRWEELTSRKFGFVICDESHYLKNYKAQRTLAIVPFLRKAKGKVLLTGTPALSRPLDLFTQLNVVAPDLFPSLRQFCFRYCAPARGAQGRWVFKGATRLKELHRTLRRVMVRRRKADVMTELPPKSRSVRWIQAKRIKHLEDKLDSEELNDLLATMVGGKGFSNPHCRQVLTRLYQATGVAKIRAVRREIKRMLKTGEKFIVFAHHKHVLNGLESCLKKNVDQYIRIDGSVTGPQRHEAVRIFQNNRGCRVALMSISACGQGLTLTAARHVLFAELYWNPGQLLQAEDRVHRIGQKYHTHIQYLLGVNTLDVHMWALIASKLGVLGRTLDGGYGQTLTAQVEANTGTAETGSDDDDDDEDDEDDDCDHDDDLAGEESSTYASDDDELGIPETEDENSEDARPETRDVGAVSRFFGAVSTVAAEAPTRASRTNGRRVVYHRSGFGGANVQSELGTGPPDGEAEIFRAEREGYATHTVEKSREKNVSESINTHAAAAAAPGAVVCAQSKHGETINWYKAADVARNDTDLQQTEASCNSPDSEQSQISDKPIPPTPVAPSPVDHLLLGSIGRKAESKGVAASSVDAVRIPSSVASFLQRRKQLKGKH